MLERELNTMVVKSFDWGYKIPDPMKSDAFRAAPRPFDGMGVVSGSVVFFESKFMKQYQAFAFKRIEAHQWQNLLKIKKAAPDVPTLILLGIKILRGVDLFAFDIEYLQELALTSKSVSKATLLTLPHVTSKYGKFPMEELLSKTIRREHESKRKSSTG